MMIRSNGISLHIEQRGAGAPAIVFLHYWGGSTRTWRHVVDALAPDFRTITADQRGWGKSDAPLDGYTLTAMADDAQGLIAELDLEHYIVVGHSMGAKVAQLLASRRPCGLQGLVLLAPAPPGPLELPLAVRQGMVQAYDSRESVLATVQQVLAPNGLSAADLEIVVADSLAGAPAAKQAWPMTISQEDIRHAMAAIDVPVMMLSGEHDRVDPPDVIRRELLARVRQAQLCILPEAGHLLPLEAPAEVAASIRSFANALIRKSPALPTEPARRLH